MSKKREQWNVQLEGGKIVTLAARSKAEALRLGSKRNGVAAAAAWVGKREATTPPKPKAIPGVSGTAKRASHPATPPLTPERVKELAVQGIVEVVGKGLRDLLKGLMG